MKKEIREDWFPVRTLKTKVKKNTFKSNHLLKEVWKLLLLLFACWDLQLTGVNCQHNQAIITKLKQSKTLPLLFFQ